MQEPSIAYGRPDVARIFKINLLIEAPRVIKNAVFWDVTLAIPVN
jgi:hypothetical protein